MKLPRLGIGISRRVGRAVRLMKQEIMDWDKWEGGSEDCQSYETAETRDWDKWGRGGGGRGRTISLMKQKRLGIRIRGKGGLSVL